MIHGAQRYAAVWHVQFIASCFCVQGVCDSPSERCQNGMEGQNESMQVKTPSSKRLYNWNTTHFYPDVHTLDKEELSISRQRRHSEPRCFLRFTDNVSNDQQSSDSSSSLAGFDEVNDKQDTTGTMPVSQLTVQLAAPNTACSTTSDHIAKVDVDLDSGSESEDDVPKTWHRSPLHIRRGRHSGVGGRSRKKTDSSISAGVTGAELWKRASDRPSIRMKERAEKRREFLQQRCQMYGWDLTADQEKHAVEDGRTEEIQQSATEEDICFIDHFPENNFVNQDSIERSSVSTASVTVNDYTPQIEASETLLKDSNHCNDKSGRLVHVSSIDMSCPESMTMNISAKESSSFENIYDTVSLEPDKSSDDVEVVHLYEPRQARAVYCHAEPLTSSKLPQADLQPSASPHSYTPSDRNKNLSSFANTSNTPVSVAACNIITARPSSAPSKSMQKASLDAKSIVEEEKLKFVEYRIEYRRQHSSGNESGSGKSDGEKDMRRQPEPTSKPHIPPDDYEYILRKIHYNRPHSKTDQNRATSQPCSTNQGSELHIMIKNPQTVTHHITVDVPKPSVPHRVESLQHSDLHNQLPARPDVIPSPNYPPSPSVIAGDFGDVTDTGKDLSVCPNRPARTVLHMNNPSVSSGPPALPVRCGNSVYQWDSGIRAPDSKRFTCNKPQYVGATSVNSQSTEPGRKPPKPPREEFPQNQSPDFWNYNTTYEPSLSSQPQLPRSVLSKDREMLHASKAEVKDCAKLGNQDLVHDLVRGLAENSELTSEATQVFREQYRWSIHEPCHSVAPDQLKHNHVSQLPRSQVFASSVCVPSKPVQLVGQPLSKDSGRACSRKETVFSVTGYHRPQQQKTNCLSQNIQPKNNQMCPSYSDIRDSYSKDSAVEHEPLHRSEADKRKPIINSPEVETALNRDCQQRYCSSRYVDGQNLTWENSRKQCSEVDDGLAGWKRDLGRRDNYAERDLHKDGRLLGQKSQDRLVQQMSVGSQEATGHIQSNYSYCATSFPLSGPHNINVHAPSNHNHTGKSSSSRSFRQPPTEVGQHRDVQSLNTSNDVPSRASTNYEKHILRSQESYRSQVMAQIEPVSVEAVYTAQNKSLSAKSCQNVTSRFTSHGVSKGCSAGRMTGFEVGVRNDVGTSSDRFVHETCYKNIGESCLTNQEKSELYDDEDHYPVSVSEIKAKLFGTNEDGARKLFQRQSDAVKGSQTDRAGGGTLNDHKSYSNSEQKKRPFISDELTDFEKLVERLDKGDTSLENHSKWCGIPMSGAQCSSADDPTVKRLSVTNIKTLETGRGKQSPSLEYAKEWLINGRHAATSVVSDKSSERVLSSYVAEENALKSNAHKLPPAENVGNFMSHKSTKILPGTKSDDVCRPVAASNVSSSSTDEVTKSHTGRVRSTPMEGSVVFRRPAEHVPIHGSSSNSFARRSLPALTEKDAERWRNMVSRIQENESRKEAKSRSVERLSQPFYDLELCSGSTVSMQMPVGMLATASDNAERKLTVTAQPLLHSTSDVMIPADHASLKPKRQQTPRDVKSRDESRMKGIHALHTNTDSGYLDSGSDSHCSSGIDMPKQRSESNGSDELELQRCDEDEAIKMSDGSLSVANIDSTFPLADKTDTCEALVSEYKVSTESSENRAKQLQKLREDWFSKNTQSHSSSLSDKSGSINTPQSHTLDKDVGFEHSESSEFRRSVPLNLGLPKGKPAKPLYVSPLLQTSTCGIYRTPPSVVTRGSVDHSCAIVDSTHLPSPSKISSFKMTFPSQAPGQNIGSGDKSVATPQPSKVTHIPVRAAGFHSGHSSARSSAFTPYVEHKDLQISRTGTGGKNITEVKKELIQIEPEQYKASRVLERTVDQPSLKAYQRASEQFKHEMHEVKEPNLKITRQVTDSKIERFYRIESHPQPKALQLTARNELDKCETSDGEMTDATDVTLDVMVGANQSLTPTVDVVDFSDVEFLSSANLPAKYGNDFVQGSAKPCASHSFNRNLADAHRIWSDVGSGDASITAAKAEAELYKKNKKDVQTDGEPPVERRRSIKELVNSFEGMTSSFMRVRPRSMEIRISSSSEEENEDDNAAKSKRKNVTLRASSSFKEATRLDRKNRQQTTVSQ